MKRKKIICLKHDEKIGALIHFEIVDVVKIYSTYLLLFKNYCIISEFNEV